MAIIAVALVKKLLADLEDIKLSCETPNPKAPPSDFCIKTKNTNNIARITFIVKTKYSPLTIQMGWIGIFASHMFGAILYN